MFKLDMWVLYPNQFTGVQMICLAVIVSDATLQETSRLTGLLNEANWTDCSESDNMQPYPQPDECESILNRFVVCWWCKNYKSGSVGLTGLKCKHCVLYCVEINVIYTADASFRLSHVSLKSEVPLLWWCALWKANLIKNSLHIKKVNWIRETPTIWY